MQEILYLEVPTTEVEAVKAWLWSQFQPNIGEKVITRSGCCLRFEPGGGGELSLFVWSVQRTTYLKVFRWSKTALAIEGRILRQLTEELRTAFPAQYPCPPVLQLENESSIFTALQAHYPLTVKYFQRMPNGAADLERVYWWEQRWREGVRYPQQPRQVIFPLEQERRSGDDRQGIYDLIYLGGALGVIHAALMARLGYRVLLIERLPFGRMNREWNISRMEFQSLIDLGLFTPAEFESVIAREYRDGFHKFFDANNPPNVGPPSCIPLPC